MGWWMTPLFRLVAFILSIHNFPPSFMLTMLTPKKITTGYFPFHLLLYPKSIPCWGSDPMDILAFTVTGKARSLVIMFKLDWTSYYVWRINFRIGEDCPGCISQVGDKAQMRCNVLLRPRPVTLKHYRSLSRRVNQQKGGNPIPTALPGPILPSSEPWSAFSMWHPLINFPYSCVCLTAGTSSPERQSSEDFPRLLILQIRLSCLQGVKVDISHHVYLPLCDMILLPYSPPEWFPKTFGTDRFGNKPRGRGKKVSNSFQGYQNSNNLIASLKKKQTSTAVHTVHPHHLRPKWHAAITG
jgi:hypothetical protein